MADSKGSNGRSGGNEGDVGNGWDAFDWESWGQESAPNSHVARGEVRGDLAHLSDDGDERRSEEPDGDEPSVSGGAWVSHGGILRWEGEGEEEAIGIRAEAESRWAADDVDLPPGAPDTLRIRATRAWLARQRQLESEAVGVLLAERRSQKQTETHHEYAHRERTSREPRDEGPLGLALAEHTAAMQEYERLLELMQETSEHSGPSRVLVELHLALTERLAALASAPEAPAGFAAHVLVAEVEGEEAARQGASPPTPRSSAEWEGQAQAVLAARRRVERVSAPEPED